MIKRKIRTRSAEAEAQRGAIVHDASLRFGLCTLNLNSSLVLNHLPNPTLHLTHSLFEQRLKEDFSGERICSGRVVQINAPTTREQLCPPKPKLLARTLRTGMRRAVLGT
jgi:hypothetical protein